MVGHVGDWKRIEDAGCYPEKIEERPAIHRPMIEGSASNFLWLNMIVTQHRSL